MTDAALDVTEKATAFTREPVMANIMAISETLHKLGQWRGLVSIVNVDGLNSTVPVGGFDIVRSFGGQCPKSALNNSMLLHFPCFARSINCFSRVLS